METKINQNTIQNTKTQLLKYQEDYLNMIGVFTYIVRLTNVVANNDIIVMTLKLLLKVSHRSNGEDLLDF
jgi:hypothetical protein